MRKKLLISVVLFTLLAFVCSAGVSFAPKEVETILKGVVVDRPQSNVLILLKTGEDPRLNGQRIKITDGTFTYEFTHSDEEEYELFFDEEFQQGSMRAFSFFAESGLVEVVLHARDKWNANRVAGGPHNQEAAAFKAERDAKFDFEKLYSAMQAMGRNQLTAEAMELYEKSGKTENQAERDSISNRLRTMSDEERFSPAFLDLRRQGAEMQTACEKWTSEYIDQHPTLFSYSHIFRKLLAVQRYGQTDDMAVLTAQYNKFAKRFPKHTYTQTAGLILNSVVSIKVGGHYLDFSAPDLNGKEHKLSKLIDGKVALIDLWASWCGPCRRKSISMIPVYEQYKEKGFTIVGVARERDNTEAMQKAIATDAYPWMSLVELNDRSKIWDMYGVGNAGGRTVLVDKSGKILAIDPSADQVQFLLEQELK